MLHGLDHAVARPRRHAETVSRPVHALMMRAVDLKGRTEEPGDEGTRDGLAGMHAVLSGEGLVVPGGGQILNQGASQSDIDQLMAAADAEDRLAGLQKAAERVQLQPVQCLFKLGGRILLLPVQGGIDIHPAGKQQPVADLRTKTFPQHGESPAPNQRLDIIIG